MGVGEGGRVSKLLGVLRPVNQYGYIRAKGVGGGRGVETLGTCVCAGVHACVCLGSDEKDFE